MMALVVPTRTSATGVGEKFGTTLLSAVSGLCTQFAPGDRLGNGPVTACESDPSSGHRNESEQVLSRLVWGFVRESLLKTLIQARIAVASIALGAPSATIKQNKSAELDGGTRSCPVGFDISCQLPDLDLEIEKHTLRARQKSSRVAISLGPCHE
jgi:hypothetical protein